MTDTGTWERRANEVILDREKTTQVDGATGYASFFSVFEFWPDRDNDDEIYVISGNQDAIALQASLLLALNQMLDIKLGGRADLEKWAEEFEDEFPSFRDDRDGQPRRDRPWGKPREERPRIVELTPNYDELKFKVVKLIPNREQPEFYRLFSGSAAQIIDQITTFWNFYLEMEGRDIGAFLGYPIDEYSRQKPKTGVKLTLVFTTFKEPPFYKSDRYDRPERAPYFLKRQVTIAQPNRSIFEYQSLRNACGGSSGLSWGNWTARAYIASENDRADGSIKGLSQMVARGDSKQTAMTNLERFLALSDATVRTIHVTHQNARDEGGSSDRDRFLRSFQIYPAWCFVENAALVRADDTRHGGKPTLSGKLVSKKNKLFLWSEREPSEFQSVLNELMRSPLS